MPRRTEIPDDQPRSVLSTSTCDRGVAFASQLDYRRLDFGSPNGTTTLSPNQNS